MITYNRVHETERSALKNEAKEKYNFVNNFTCVLVTQLSLKPPGVIAGLFF
jgi:hypothetical protein